MNEDKMKTGTTTVGLTFKDGVVLATERRATMGTLIAHKVTKKLFKIDDNLGLTVAGLVGDAQLLARYLRAEVALYRVRRGDYMTVNGAATLMANILSGQRFIPYWVALVLGGYDYTGNHVFALDAAGGAIEDKYVTTGSGSPFVYAVLENDYSENMKRDDAINLAIKAIGTAMKRDAASGDGIEVAVISPSKGFEYLDEKDVIKRGEKLGIKLA
ncbi:MAG: proteasome endopeptidase complex, archaeal, beta subunit [Thermoplasmata archaeon]|nr:MAG: proteasome endopeptidase complex, archaeal, beta subunit [Thermoplasmata archaeon]